MTSFISISWNHHLFPLLFMNWFNTLNYLSTTTLGAFPSNHYKELLLGFRKDFGRTPVFHTPFPFLFCLLVPSGFETNNSSENGSLWQNITIARLQSNWDFNGNVNKIFAMCNTRQMTPNNVTSFISPTTVLPFLCNNPDAVCCYPLSCIDR